MEATQVEQGGQYRFTGSRLLGVPAGSVIPVERRAGSGEWFNCRLADGSFLSIHVSDLRCAS